MSKKASQRFNMILNNVERSNLNNIANNYIQSTSILDTSHSDYDHYRAQEAAIKQEIGEAILYYLQHQKVLNPRFIPTLTKIESWCSLQQNNHCTTPLNIHNSTTQLDSEKGPSNGFSLIVGKPNQSTTIQTVLATIPGQSYTLSFNFSGNFINYNEMNYSYQPVSLQVEIADEKISLFKQHPLITEEFWINGRRGTVDRPFHNTTDGRSWEKVEVQFIANSHQTTLSFLNNAYTSQGIQTSPAILSNVMVYDDITADKDLNHRYLATIASTGAVLSGLGATTVYLAKKGMIGNPFQVLGFSSTTIGPKTATESFTSAFNDLHSIMKTGGAQQAIHEYLAIPTEEYAQAYYHQEVSTTELDIMSEIGFLEAGTGLPANQASIETGGTTLVKTINQSADVAEKTVIKFDSQTAAANFAKQLDSYLLREVDAIPGIHEKIGSISVNIGAEGSTAEVAGHESVEILHSAAEIEFGNAGKMGISEFITKFVIERGFSASVVDSLPFIYNTTSLAGIGWNSHIGDVNEVASESISSAYEAGMSASEFGAAALEGLEITGIILL
ncbi:hypothetical protein [Vibrio sagamiensis]|uniref:Uncharacterized protein n=2 Tax=Vibrio sagamiensis TaxID=512650 RepID=A0A511QHQ8_9VIBR|nr:hypothetical protein [Vibrio sagamiensis]GEM76850.1 hypothetical protein VSA01S_29620 [Vibrio sagamiensis NBRC 104589]